MPAMPPFCVTAPQRHAAAILTAAERVQATARRPRATTEQAIINSECRATKLRLADDKDVWRADRRRRGLPAADFVPYLT